jgi:hypothetical protein
MKSKVLTTLLAATLGGAALLAAPASWADNGKFSLASGLDYSTGKYGTASTTNILSIPVVGKYATGPWVFKLTAPYVRISGMGDVVPGTGRIRTSGSAGNTQSGPGDTVAAATYNLYEESETTLGVDLTGKIKLATADTGLGSGANDYAAQMDVYQSMDKFTAMGSLGSKILGSPTGITLNTVFYGSFGGVYQFTNRTSGGVDMSLAQSPSALSARQHEFTAFVSYKIDKHLKAQGYVLKGFSDGSPDKGVGALFSYGF